MLYDKNGKTMGENLIDYYAQKAGYETQAEEIIRAQKIYDYLKNDSAAIRWHLSSYMGKIVNAKTLANMPLIWLNEVPRIIRRLCLVYKDPAVRTLTAKEEDYKAITRQLNKASKEMHKQGKLFNTILVRPIWTGKELTYQIITRNIADITPVANDPLQMQELRYQVEYYVKDKPDTAVIHWTDDNYWATDLNGNGISFEGIPDDNVNPYGRIPFEILRFEECADFWGDGMPDLVEGQEALNGRLTDTFFKLYMSFGQPLGTNLNIKLTDFSIGYDKPLLRDGVKNDASEAAPDLKFITPDHKVELDKIVNDWFQDQLARCKGLPASSIRYTSGYEREVDNFELLDINQDDQEILREFEERRFELEKVVLKIDAGKDFGSAKYSVQFAPIEFPLTETETWERRENEYKYNMSTPIDWVKEESPTLEDEQIKQMLAKNRALKIELGGATPSLFEIANRRPENEV